jgi:hypothetical protein
MQPMQFSVKMNLLDVPAAASVVRSAVGNCGNVPTCGQRASQAMPS